jgi:UPF0271 protein
VGRPLLNIDLGELPDEPEELYASADIANIACGGHAGDDASIARAVARCERHGVRIGAHPSYPDKGGFGRRRLAMPPDALEAAVAEQCAALARAARAKALPVAYVKAHGALYHAAAEDAATAAALVRGVATSLGTDITVLGGGLLAGAAEGAGMRFAKEGFADRGVRADGSLVPRGEPGAVVTNPARAAARARELAASGTVATICVHGDTPGAVDVARAVRAALDALDAAVRIEPFGDGALRIRLPENVDGAALLRVLCAQPGVVDAVVTERHALVTFDPSARPDALDGAIEAAVGGAAHGTSATTAATTLARTHTIGVRYDGDDLDAVAAAAGLDRAAAIAIHSGAVYTVAAIGFLPGFAYLRGLDPRLVLPRRPVPRPRVAALSVAIAGPYAGVYPLASPGGWHLLGTAVGFAPFSADAGAALALGDRVVFTEIAP